MLSSLSSEELDSIFLNWVAHDWIRELDRALALLLREQEPEACVLSLFSAALVSHQLGRGHICLPLDQVLQEPNEALALPPDPREPRAQSHPVLPTPQELLKTLDLSVWKDALLVSPLVDDGAGQRPLVLDGNRLYLRRQWVYEQQVAKGILRRLEQRLEPPANLLERLDQMFRPLRDAAESEYREVHWQTIAAALATRSAFTVISGGPGTGKTTTVVRLLGLLQTVALDADASRPLRIRLAAPTGKAAARLTESIGAALDQLDPRVQPHIPSDVTTVHRLLRPIAGSRQFRHHAGCPLHLDVLVVDEASMVDLELMAALLEALPARARLILLGDKDQLASVEAGAVLGELCRDADKPGYGQELCQWLRLQTGYDLSAWQGPGNGLAEHIALLRKSHRFDEQSGIGQLARAVNSGKREAVESVWRRGFKDIGRLALTARDDSRWQQLILNGEAGQFGADFAARRDRSGELVPAPRGYRHYLEVLHQQRPASADPEACMAWARSVLDAFGRFQLLTPLRQGDWGVSGLNMRVQAVLQEAGLIARQGAAWYEGRPVLVTRNDYGLGLMNGDIGIALADPLSGGRLRVFFAMADGGIKRVLPSRLVDVETVYAMTVHKSQGSEFSHTVLILPDRPSPILTRELVYTGITRAKDWLTLAGPKLALLDDAIERQIRRASGLSELLSSKYLGEFKGL